MEKGFQIHWPSFIIAFAVGLLYVYVSAPPKKVVLKYPNPYNAGKIVYHDNADNCFVFDAKKTQCPKDRGMLKKQPILL